MEAFDVLSRTTNCHSSYFLEASAGTGKTFAIEHLVCRLLIDGLELDKILIVTFTKAAVRDLKKRIYNNIRKLMEALVRGERPFDYLQEVDLTHALSLLQRAYIHFEKSQIFTLHSYCLRMLKELSFYTDAPLPLPNDDLASQNEEQIVRDFLHFGLKEQDYSPGQMAKLLKRKDLVERTLFWMQKGKKIKHEEPFGVHLEAFCELRHKFGHCSEELYDECLKLTSYFTGLCDRRGNVKPEILKVISGFTSLFSKEKWEAVDLDCLLEKGFPPLDFFSPKLAKKKTAPPSFSPLLHEITQHLGPIVEKASCEEKIFARLVSDCLSLKNKTALFWSPDDIVKQMLKTTCKDEVLTRLQERYKTAIIDEFQDTDPMQWEIFKKVFVDSKVQCILVGDPKQSIYAFRRADIYTYLEARDALSRATKASLLTNYRSSEPLQKALNALFTQKAWMPLPKRDEMLPIHPVRPGVLRQEGKVHFFISEAKDERLLFAFIAKQILERNKPFKDVAILVKDRYEGARLIEFLKSKGIPSQARRTTPLIETPGFTSMQHLLTLLIDPTTLPLALLDPLFGFDVNQAKKADHLYAEIQILASHPRFFDQLLFQPNGFSQHTVAEDLIARVGGKELLRQIMQIWELLLEKGAGFTPKEGLERLKALRDAQEPSKEANVGGDSVTILTLHMSKGLEFEEVFALALVGRSAKRDELVEKEGELVAADLEIEEHLLEKDAEKMRQLYVAMTRARSHLYVPVILMKETPALGMGSPMEIFLQAQLGTVTKESLIHWLEKIPFVSYSFLDESLMLTPAKLEKQSLILPPAPLTPVLVQSNEQYYSYSSLAPPSEVISRPGGDFPGGTLVGNLLHKIMEIGFFPLKGTVLEGFEEQVKRVVDNAWKAPLSGFTLADVDPKLMLKELEFLIPWDEDVSELERKDGFITGFIDLVFQHDNRYWILDWKSNILDKYTQEAMHEEMIRHHYHLQASIYRMALKKYLALVEKRPFDKCFGKVIYFFMRGPGVYVCDY